LVVKNVDKSYFNFIMFRYFSADTSIVISIFDSPTRQKSNAPRICYGFLTNPPAGTKPPALGKRTANPKELNRPFKGTVFRSFIRN
jgi:hypothetical protein